MANSENSTHRHVRSDPSSVGSIFSKDHHLDVICAGMYRACSTWQYTVAAHLIERYRDGIRLGYLSGEDYANRRLPSKRRSGKYKGPHLSEKTGGWSVFKSHDGDRFFAKALESRQALVLYAYRDVRDVIFSLMHKRGLSFEQILKQGMIQQILANDRFWTKSDRVLIQKYEDLVAEPTTGVIQIAEHLGIGIDIAEAAEIASEYSAESNRARIESLQSSLKESGLDLNEASNQQICDPTTLLHWNHLRPARTETWRDLATPSQRRILERMFGDWLEARGYPRDNHLLLGNNSQASTLSERIREEADTVRGWVSCQLYNATLNYPKAARFAKGLLKPKSTETAGAVAWKNTISRSSHKAKQKAESSTHAR